jgi:ABC-type lipopolysaccharide export system ATPase subunit
LELYCRIKCVREGEIAPVCDDLITLMDLTKFRHKRAGTLSGGNRRKLSLALALIGEPPLLFLGEAEKSCPETLSLHDCRRFVFVVSRLPAADEPSTGVVSACPSRLYSRS